MSHPSSLLADIQAIFEDANVQAVLDPSLPGFIVPLHGHHEPLCLYLRVGDDQELLFRITVPVPIADDHVLPAVALSNEVNAHIRLGRTALLLDRGFIVAEIGRIIFGKIIPEELHLHCTAVHNLALSLIPPLRALQAGQEEPSEIINLWLECANTILDNSAARSEDEELSPSTPASTRD